MMCIVVATRWICMKQHVLGVTSNPISSGTGGATKSCSSQSPSPKYLSQLKLGFQPPPLNSIDRKSHLKTVHPQTLFSTRRLQSLHAVQQMTGCLPLAGRAAGRDSSLTTSSPSPKKINWTVSSCQKSARISESKALKLKTSGWTATWRNKCQHLKSL